MRECKVEQSSLTYRCVFDNMLSSLPVPGTQVFATLCRGLRPYGISPSGVVVEAPSSRLGDVTLGISLLDDVAELRLSYGWFELSIKKLYTEDKASLIKIVELLFITLREVDAEVRQGRVTVRSYAHLSLASLDAEAFLHEHLHASDISPSVIPDAFAYKLRLSGADGTQEAHVVAAKSLQFEKALFVDFAIEYAVPGEPAQTAEQIDKDYREALELLGLELSDL